MGEVFTFTSGKGGVGKTTTTANVGAGLSLLDKKVVLVDTDIGLRNLDVVMGLENRILYNLVDVLTGRCRVKQALIRDKRYPNLWIIPSSCSGDSKNNLNEKQMKNLLSDLRKEFDYVLIDSPAGSDGGFRPHYCGHNAADCGDSRCGLCNPASAPEKGAPDRSAGQRLPQTDGA